MKKHFKLVLFLLCAVLFLSSCTSYYISKYDHIGLEDVDYVTFYGTLPYSHEDRELTAEETEKLLELYNAAEKVRERRDGDTTPSFGVKIHLKNGKKISVSDFPYMGHTLEVRHGKYKYRFFINSDELADYMEGLYKP